MLPSLAHIFRFLCLALLGSALCLGQPRELASNAIPADKLQAYADLAQQWEQEYLRIDTSNPPGNEARAAAFFKRIFDQEGIENQVFEYQPARANIWARIPAGSQNPKRPIILLNHEDVVTSDPARWKVPPFSGEIVE